MYSFLSIYQYVCSIHLSTITIDNSILKKYIAIKISRQVYFDRIYMVTQFQNYNNYKHPFEIGGHKTEFLENFIKVLKNNTLMVTFYEQNNNTTKIIK